jgi:aspartyl-tRNA(Asn)/glutamyl-tRNA(Gln) amidotransferase subunit A
MPAEASSNLARYDGIRYGLAEKDAINLFAHYAQSRATGFGPEVKRRIMVGTYVLSSGYADAYYHQAVRVRQTLSEEFHQVFDQVDILLGPTSPIKPFPLGEKKADPLAMYLADLLTVPANLTGLPAISVPAGLVDGLPVGLQLIGRAGDENCVLRTARAYEQATDWHHQHPAG